MNDLLAPLFNLLPAMWQRRWWGLWVAWGVALLGALGVFSFKDRYEASATVYVDTQSTLRPLLQGLAVQPEVGDQINLLARTLLSRANLDAVIDHEHMLPPDAPANRRALLRQYLGRTIHIKISGGGASNNIYEVSYIGTDRASTLGVVQTLMGLFVKNGLATNAQDSRQALQFINSQIALYEDKLHAAESRLRDFRSAHPGYSAPGANNLTAQQGQLQDQIVTLQGQLAAASSSRDALQAQLASVQPTLAPDLMPGVFAGMTAQPDSIDQRIAVLQSKLADLLQRYTDAYPDVIATRQSLARLEAERTRQKARAAQSSQKQQYSQATNPVYQQLRISLAQANANVASLQAQVSDVRSRLQQLQERERQMPGLDEQYVELTRDFGVLNDTYQKLMQRREAAMLSLNQDTTRRKDYFHMVDPPRLAPSPLFPSKITLITAVLLAALIAGVLTTYAHVMLLPCYHTARQLREGSDRPVLGTVTMVLTREASRGERRQQVVFFAASGLLVALLVAWALTSKLHF